MAPTKRDRVRFSLQVLGLSLLAAYLSAAAFVIAQFISLPANDLAYHQPLSLIDPFVVSIAMTFATVIGLLAFPLALFCVWHRDLRRCSLFVIGLTFSFIIVATLVDNRVGLLGGPVVGLAASLFCRFSHLAFFQPREASGLVA